MVTADAVVGRSSGVLWRTGPFGVVLLAPAMDRPVVVAGSGAALWESLVVARPARDVVAELSARFGVDPVTVEHDVMPVLEHLVELGACEVVE
jgi:hypothetical protein